MQVKTTLFRVILLLFVYFIIEIMSYGFFLVQGVPFSFQSFTTDREAIVAQFDKQQSERGINYLNKDKKEKVESLETILHPYLGYIDHGTDLSITCEEGKKHCDRRIRTYDDFPFRKKDENAVIVGITGGSFAGGVAKYSSDRLGLELAKIPEYQGKEIVFLNMAPGGYKQPQQLMKLNYFLTLGAEFDIIINIDGFNEIALPRIENKPKGIHPIFPRGWYYLVDSALNSEVLAVFGTRQHYRNQRAKWARFVNDSSFKFSVFSNLIWRLNDDRLSRNIGHLDVELVDYVNQGGNRNKYVASGPDYTYTNDDEYFEYLTSIWARSTQLMHQIATSQGIDYYHFIQPNQYIEGSKIMSDEERAIAISEESRYGQAIRQAYPGLIKQARQFRSNGIPVYDLTMIFENNPKSLYIDDCCHLNIPGYILVAKEIVKHIAREKRKPE